MYVSTNFLKSLKV
uniref:Uncharacterized protein n=1 Tax=Anguilla anguilla TaxID=7936 RepID=A0A0E9UQC1_ANGAN